MSEQGWICLYRKIRESWLWDEKPFDKAHAWLDILLSANHQDKKFPLGSQLIVVKRGSFITSIRKLCEKWGWSNTKVVTFLELLKSDGMIDYLSDKKKTVITIENYSVYQDINDTETSQERHENATETPLKHTNNNDNNDNNDNKINNMSTGLTPYDEIKEIFNSICTTLPKVIDINGNRQKSVKTRWKEHHDISFFKELFKKVNDSDFLSGRNDKWKGCCFDWIMKPASLQKIIEGNYDNKNDKSNDDWRI